MEPIYGLSGIKKSYAGRLVLDIGSLDIFNNELLGIVGPSGSGKSTLLRLLNFLEAQDEGSITFHRRDGHPKTIPLEMQRKITTVFQNPALIDTTVRRNIEFGLRLRGNRDSKELVDSLLELIGMSHLANAQSRSLSGGEAQRVALARAIILQPEVLLLDEPTANLDPANVDIIEKVIHELFQAKKTTIVLVTHNIFQARRLAQRVALMLNGRIVEVNPTEKFFEQPDDTRTAAFVRGEMVW
jgi:tungstate transport system ATP-binding protein